MDNNVFLAISRNRIARARCMHAEPARSERWEVEVLLEGQDVRCLAANPQDTNLLYAGTQGNGVYHSSDGGITWQPGGLAGKIIKSLAVSPHDPQTIFAGTKPAYLYRSKNGGRSWQELLGFRRIPFRWWWFSPAETPNLAYVNAIAISPDDPNTLLAGIEFGAVVRSEDGGETWSGHRPGALRDCHSLKFHAVHGKWAYEAGGTGGGASYSFDGGNSWRQVKHGLTRHYGVGCAADPVQPDTWYVSVAPSPFKAYGSDVEAYLYRARGAAGWQPIGWESHPMKHMPVALVTLPGAPGQLYAGVTNGDIWQSGDYGDSWQKLPINLGEISDLLVISR